MSATPQGVSLRDLLTSHSTTELTPHHIPSYGQSVRDIALITDVDRILTLGPDSIVLLGEELALGGWVVSVALRYAWERRAVALIVSEQSFSESVIELARRFGVALFSTGDGIDRTAVKLARELGALEAGVLTRLEALHTRVIGATSVHGVLSVLSQQLGDALVQVVVADVALFQAGQRPADSVEIRVPLTAGGNGQELTAAVPRQQHEVAGQALARASATIRALLLEQELDDLSRAAPLLTFAALTGLRERGAADMHRWVGEASNRWPDATPVVAVALRVLNGVDDDMASRIGPVVSRRWREAFPRSPLSRTHEGWFAFVATAGSVTETNLALRKLALSDLRPLGVTVGTSSDDDGVEQPTRLLRRAWLAARLAEPDGSVVEFHRMGPPLVRRVLPAEDALELSSMAFPGLLSDPHAADVIAAVLAYLDCAGSVTAAAERLGIHRNTLQIRLRRAAELGVPLTEPEQLLSTHLLLAALDRTAIPKPSADDQ